MSAAALAAPAHGRGMPLTVLVECAPLHVRSLQLGTCVSRWRQANGKAKAFVEDLGLSACRGCATGRARADVAMPEPAATDPGTHAQNWRHCKLCRRAGIGGIETCERCGAPIGLEDDTQATSPRRDENDALWCPYCQRGPLRRLERIAGGHRACRRCVRRGVSGAPPARKRAPVPRAVLRADRERRELVAVREVLYQRATLAAKHAVEREVLARNQDAEARRLDAVLAAAERSDPSTFARVRALFAIEGGAWQRMRAVLDAARAARRPAREDARQLRFVWTEAACGS